MLSVSSCAMNVCPAIAYMYGGPAVVEFDPTLPPGSAVESCFGDECEPVAVTAGRVDEWEVPQETPYISPDSIPGGEIRVLRIVASTATGVVVDDTFEIPILVEPEGVFGQCPGPFRFDTVVVEWDAERG